MLETRGRARWLALSVLCAATLMIILDGTIVTVALPSIQRSLDFTPAGLEWVMNAYLIAFGGLLLLGGRLGDLAGSKRVFISGVLLFTVASLACGLAAAPAMLIAARFAQGAGGALASAVSLGMIVNLFPGPRDRARAMGIYTFTGAGGASVGLVLGGLLTSSAGWHWIFTVNIPIGCAVAVLGVLLLEDVPGAGLRAGADVTGAVLVTAGLMTGVYAIAETTRYGWLSVRTLAAAGIAVVLLLAFVGRQWLARTPLLPLRLFRSREVSAANAAQALTIAAAFGFQVLIAQYTQRVLGYGPALAGVALLPTAVMIAVMSAGLSARISARIGSRRMLIAGLLPLAAGMALLVRLPVSGGYAENLLPTMLLTGGFGLALPAMITLAMSGVPAADAGAASGLVNTTQQIGSALGVAVLSTLAASRTAALAGSGAAERAALAAGYRLAFGTAAALVLAAALVAALALRPASSSSPVTEGFQERGESPLTSGPGPGGNPRPPRRAFSPLRTGSDRKGR